MSNQKIIEMLFKKENIWAIAYKNNELSFFYDEKEENAYDINKKVTVTSTRLREIIFDGLGLYIGTCLGEDSTDGKWWIANSSNFQTYDNNEIVAILNCVDIQLKKDKS